jgi:hypothetical protein
LPEVTREFVDDWLTELRTSREFPSPLLTNQRESFLVWWEKMPSQHVKATDLPIQYWRPMSPNIGILFASKRQLWITLVNIAAS